MQDNEVHAWSQSGGKRVIRVEKVIEDFVHKLDG